MKVSKAFRAAVKLADRPAWKIAYEAGIHPNVLSKIITGAVKVKRGDPRVLRVAHVLGLKPGECFEEDEKGDEAK